MKNQVWVLIVLTLALVTQITYANDKVVDKGMKVPLKVEVQAVNSKPTVFVGIDLFGFGKHKTLATETTAVTTSGGGNSGMFAGMGKWISENPWKAALITAVVGYGAYELSDSSSSRKDGTATAGQGGSASSSSQKIDLSNNQGTINFNYTGDDSAGQSGRDTVPFVEE